MQEVTDWSEYQLQLKKFPPIPPKPEPVLITWDPLVESDKPKTEEPTSSTPKVRKFDPLAAMRNSARAEATKQFYFRSDLHFELPSPESFEIGSQDERSSYFMMRLDELDLSSVSNEEVLDLKSLHNRVQNYWSGDRKIFALKLVIHSIKNFGAAGTENIEILPRVFSYIVRSLDEFAKLVRERLIQTANKHLSPSKLPDLFSVTDIPPIVQEMAKNWVNKVNTIRELAPRVTLEAALLPLYQFTSAFEDPIALFTRLLKQCRGFANVAIAVYMRMFIVHVGIESLQSDLLSEHIFETLRDSLRQLIRAKQENSMLVSEEFIHIYDHPFKLFGFALKKNQRITSLLPFFKQLPSSYFVSFISQMPSATLAKISKPCLDLILTLDHSVEHPLSAVLYEFSGRISKAELDEQSVSYIAETLVSKSREFEDPNQIMESCAGTVEFLVGHNITANVKLLCKTIAINFSDSKDRSELFNVKKMLYDVISASKDVTFLLSLDPFVALLSFLPTDWTSELSMLLLEKLDTTPIEDLKHRDNPIVIHSILNFSRMIAKTTDFLSNKDKMVLIEERLSNVLLIPVFNNINAQLNFLSDCRREFLSFDSIQVTILTHLLAVMGSIKSTGKRPVSKDANFLKGCLAFVAISSPSVANYHERCKILSSACHIALLHGLVSHAEECWDLLLKNIKAMPAYTHGIQGKQSTLSQFKNIVKMALSLVPVLPVDDISEPLKRYRDLLDFVTGSEALIQEKSTLNYTETSTYDIEVRIVLVDFLGALSGLIQDDRVMYEATECNGAIYGSLDKYVSMVEQTFRRVVGRVLTKRTYLGPLTGQDGMLIALLLEKVMAYCELDDAALDVCGKFVDMVNRTEPSARSKRIVAAYHSLIQ
ncbi:hypothetical protein PCE1_000017 [Barthelona sp. PCE]